jgi:hypothetical protein
MAVRDSRAQSLRHLILRNIEECVYVCLCLCGDHNLLDNGNEGKGKAVPLQAWSDPEGSRKLRLPDCMTTAQDGSKVVILKHRPPLLLGNTPGTHLC